MTRVVLISQVTDAEHWLRGKERTATLFGQFGTDIQFYVAMDGSNRVAITADVSDMDRVARALLENPPPEVAAELERHGVILPVVAYVEA
jgi:hypothetical protein